MTTARLRQGAFFALVLFTTAMILFPIYWMTVTALSPENDIRSFPPRLFPADPQWGIFRRMLAERPLFAWLGNSFFIATAAVAISMTVSIFAGYALSRFRPRGSQAIGLFILSAKMLPSTLLIIPLFVIFRELRLIGSAWSVILAHATLIVPFTTWMLKGYFDTIPAELEQAAMVDGCTPWGALFRVVLPVSLPGLAATALYGFVLSWADYVFGLVFLTNAQLLWTVNLGISTMKGEYVTDWNEVMAASLIAALPLVVIYLFLERYLVGGLTAGSEK
jgi:multiple sugar transport system permease protein